VQTSWLRRILRCQVDPKGAWQRARFSQRRKMSGRDQGRLSSNGAVVGGYSRRLLNNGGLPGTGTVQDTNCFKLKRHSDQSYWV
jgi:hypothetical protein